ncbi:hypothetical protein J6590_018646 [Homalodisca vitripennis]|nr:hypothetical protein J6590_018646 [Homalodisca vitripennis]
MKPHFLLSQFDTAFPKKAADLAIGKRTTAPSSVDGSSQISIATTTAMYCHCAVCASGLSGVCSACPLPSLLTYASYTKLVKKGGSHEGGAQNHPVSRQVFNGNLLVGKLLPDFNHAGKSSLNSLHFLNEEFVMRIPHW